MKFIVDIQASRVPDVATFHKGKSTGQLCPLPEIILTNALCVAREMHHQIFLCRTLRFREVGDG